MRLLHKARCGWNNLTPLLARDVSPTPICKRFFGHFAPIIDAYHTWEVTLYGGSAQVFEPNAGFFLLVGCLRTSFVEDESACCVWVCVAACLLVEVRVCFVFAMVGSSGGWGLHYTEHKYSI